MPGSDIENYRRWFEYEKDSHRKVLESLNSTSEETRAHPDFQKAVDLLAHIITARKLWLYRFGVLEQGPSDLFPKGIGLSDLPSILGEMEAHWTRFLDGLTDDGLARVFEYNALDGPRYRNTIEEILTQLFGHSWYHRGQIALLLRQSGAEPAITDYVFWTRVPI